MAFVRSLMICERLFNDAMIRVNWPGMVACTCNPTTLETKFRNGMGSLPVGDNRPSIGGWIV